MMRLLGAAAVAAAVLFAPQAQAEDLEFMLINETDVAVVGLNISHAGTDQWEEDLMAGGYLPGGNEVPVIIADGLEVCVYDIRVSFDDGDAVEDYGVDLCELGSYTVDYQ